MKTRRKQSGITLMEMTVVIAAVALLAVFGLPAIRAFVNSLESKGPAEAMIDAALSSARAIALKEQHYAGIRFQKAYDPKGPLEAAQYMIFIVQDPEILAYGFRAVEGLQPIKLPDSVGVIAMVGSDSEIDAPEDINNTTTFSIIFSPSGKLVIHDVQTRNRDGATTTSKDDIFNTSTNVVNGIGMFVQDSDKELSRNSFVIYDRDKFKAAFEKGLAWSDYLKNLPPVYINPYTGTIIKQD